MTALGRLLALRERRPVFVAASLVVLAYFLAYPFVDVWLRSVGIADQFGFWDFGAYGKAIERWHAGESLYVQADDGGYFGSFLYPPLTLLAFQPFVALLEYPQTRIAWVVLTTALLIVGVQAVAGELVPEVRWWERGVLAWAVLGFQPVLLNAKMAQTAAFLGALLCLSFVFLSRQDERGDRAGYVSGALVGVVGFFKFAYAPTGAHLLADRRRFLGALATGLALVAASVAVFGVEAHLTYLEVLEWGLTSDSDGKSPTLASPPYYKPLYWIPGSLGLRIGASLAIAGFALRSEADDATLFALGVGAFPMVTPLAYVYYFVALIPAALVLLAGELRRDGRPLVPVVGLWLASVQTFATQVVIEWLEPLAASSRLLRASFPLMQPGLWGVLLIAGLAFVRAAEATTPPAWLESLARRVGVA